MGRRNRSVSVGSEASITGFRNRSASVGSSVEAGKVLTQGPRNDVEYQATKALLDDLLDHPCNVLQGNSSPRSLALSAAWLTRLQQLQNYEESRGFKTTVSGRRKQIWMTSRNKESGYTPLHNALIRGDLATTLLLLRHVSSSLAWNDLVDRGAPPSSSANTTNGRTITATQLCVASLIPPALHHRPLDLLDNAYVKNNKEELLENVMSMKDHEGFTPGQLLGKLQIQELSKCRQASVYQSQLRPLRTSAPHSSGRSSRAGQSSFDWTSGNPDDNEQDELGLLRRNLSLLQGDGRTMATDSQSTTTCEPWFYGDKGDSFACELFAFGSAHHCALGVGQDATSDHRPRRIQLERSLRNGGGAVAVAAAAYHTLVATAEGHVYAFGLGKSGRLGMGDENHCPRPARVLGPLTTRHVVSVAAAENHSLCLTNCGRVYAWGSNRFGQLGTSVEDTSSARCLPRRVEDLKSLSIVGVAAGARHSVALSDRGEIYVWGDNAAGQLGISRRNGTHKVQRVEALWSNTSSPKLAIAVAASEKATLVLTKPSFSASLPVNSIYSWGHGSHVPTRIKLEALNDKRVANPVAIDCARFHCVAITTDGLVYTWGLHSESLGNASQKKASIPQIVLGMLPEKAVAVSASENHTAVVTDTGKLFTFGATHGKNILGHEGVNYQPAPRQVPGVCRAVGVSAAREHTVLMIGTSFPPLPARDKLPTLEYIAARSVAENIDLFNTLPALIVAERTQCSELIGYCNAFIRRNLDGILNFGKKSAMNCYLNEQLIDICHYLSLNKDRDDIHDPLIMDIMVAGNFERPSFHRDILSNIDDWMKTCATIANSRKAKIATALKPELHFAPCRSSNARSSDKSQGKSPSGLSNLKSNEKYRSNEFVEFNGSFDHSSKEESEAIQIRLTKELRSTRKRLSQIAKLEVSGSTSALTVEQLEKLSRKPFLEKDLAVLEPALERIEQRLKKLSLIEEKDRKEIDCDSVTTRSSDPPKRSKRAAAVRRRCDLCNISCPDETSFALHIAGRKHRNRTTQAEDEAKREAARSVMTLKNVPSIENHPVKKIPYASSIGVQIARPSWESVASPSAVAPFRLPSPPIPVADSIVPKKTAKKSLKEIMTEEATSSSPSMVAAFSPSQPSKCNSSPWKDASSDRGRSKSLLLSPGESKTPSKCSLGDFMHSSRPEKKNTAATGQAWISPQKIDPQASHTKTFQDILQEEKEWKSKQDQSAEGCGKWYVQRRERAGSFRELQSIEEKDREHRRLVEEQIEIERQIKEDLARQRREEEIEKKRAKNKSVKRNRKGGRAKKPGKDSGKQAKTKPPSANVAA